MKKRIFIAMHYMEIGGAEISLIGLLQALDYSRYDVTMFREEDKAKQREEQFPKDLQNACELGARLVKLAAEKN